MPGECGREWQIDAIRDGRLGPQDAESFERHRRLCASCTARLAANERLRELARSLASSDPSELELRRLRARVMRDAVGADIPQKRGAGAAVARTAGLALALSAVLLVVWIVGTHRRARTALVASTADAAASVAVKSGPATSAPASSGPALAGLVLPSSDAAWSQTRDARMERVRLDVGTLIVHVRAQEPDERFLVELPDGELEVRGTTFAVTVRDGATTRVRVDEGKVELRIAGQSARVVVANEVWSAPSPRAAAHAHAAVLPLARVAPPAPHVPFGAAVGIEPSRVADDDTARYMDAVRLLRAGKNEEAANAFHMVAANRAPATQAEDASYLEAVSLARAGRLDAAAMAAEHYLDSFPESFHRKEAAILVARAARIRGDCTKARAVLAPWREAMLEPETRNVLRLCF